MESLLGIGSISLVAVFIVGLIGTLYFIKTRYVVCPSNNILVKYGRVGEGRSSVTYHGGATFVIPLIQRYAMLDLTPMTTDIDLKNALSKQNIRISVPSRFTFGIGTTELLMQNAAERLLNLPHTQIEEIVRDIVFGQLRATIATMDIEEINANREKFEQNVTENIETELEKVGLRLINVNIIDISDESGYIQALGERAAAEAINRAKVEVAQQVRDGETGSAKANQEQRVNVAAANAKAVVGENEAKAEMADSEATLREKEAEAKRRSDTAEAIKAAEAKKAGYEAERQAEITRAAVVEATNKADILVPAQIAREQAEVEAEAEKIKTVKAGEASGEALRAELEGQAQGQFALLSQKADGFRALVQAVGGKPSDAALLLIAEQLPQLVEAQTKAISNVKFDKVVVMDSGQSGNGKSTTAHWLSSLVQVLPGLHEVAEMAGIQLPDTLGQRMTPTTANSAQAPAEPPATTPRPPQAPAEPSATAADDTVEHREGDSAATAFAPDIGANLSSQDHPRASAPDGDPS